MCGITAQDNGTESEGKRIKKVSKTHHMRSSEGRRPKELPREHRRKERSKERKRRWSPSSEDTSLSFHSSEDEERGRDWLRKSMDRGAGPSSRGTNSNRKSGWKRNSKRDGAEQYLSSSSESDEGREQNSKSRKEPRIAFDKRRRGERHSEPFNDSSSDEVSSDGEADALVHRESKHGHTLPESYRRRESRKKQASMKKEANRRQSEGKKPFFVVVDSDTGEVYGNGLKNWKKEVKKISYSLDPSVVDVRRFPKEKLREAREKLAEKFEYSSKLSKGFFRSVLGRALSQRRNAVLALIESGVPCPLSFDERIWNTLRKYKDDPATQKKREDTQRARASRGSGGRTGPLGESGVRMKLSEMLGRSPDPEEIALEMKRDKGCGGRKRKAPSIQLLEPREARCCHCAQNFNYFIIYFPFVNRIQCTVVSVNGGPMQCVMWKSEYLDSSVWPLIKFWIRPW